VPRLGSASIFHFDKNDPPIGFEDLVNFRAPLAHGDYRIHEINPALGALCAVVMAVAQEIR
jgi:hypothetical protein